ncbi:MAG: CHRD domain-containing protein [Caldimonas sp.]
MKSMMMGTMNVPLAGSNEVPPNASTGSGTAKVDLDGNVLKWTVTYSGTTGPVVAGHFHGPAPAGSNSGVVVPFVPPLASPITGTVNLTAAQVADLKAGLWYVNLHTAAHPGGELRGQVK